MAERGHGARTVARKLALQALYQWQLNASPWQDLVNEFHTDEDMPRADEAYFMGIVRGVIEAQEQLDTQLGAWADRAPNELDPIERAALWMSLHELVAQPEVPWRVVVNEAVSLTKRFGATDAHKYVNAVLDRAARELRPHEH